MVGALKSLRSDANFDSETSSMTWRALNSLTKEQGGPAIDYKRFAARWDQEERLPPEEQTLHKLVRSFDGQGLVIKTDEQKDQVPKGEPKQNRIQAMAKRASAKELG